MTPEQAEEQVRQDASDRMQHNTTSDLSARLMCRVGFRELTLLLAHYDGLKRAHAAALAPAVPEGWEPIETAPRDGREINGYRPDQGVFTFRWAHMEEFVAKDRNGDPLEEYDDFEGWWHDRWAWMQGDEEPTHWRPLPAPPARPLPTEGDAGRAALEAEKTTHQEPEHER